MRHDTVNYLLVGTFVLAVLGALLFVLAMITGRTGATDSYHTHYANVAGLKYGTLVTYEGYHIGQVEQITPVPGDDGTRYRVEYAVKKDWKIPSNSLARIVNTGLLSAVSIDIDEGTDDTFLNPGDEVGGEAGVDLFLTIADVATDLSTLTTESVQPLVERISAALLAITEQTQASVPEILERLESLGRKLEDSADQIPNILAELQGMAVKLNEGAGRVGDLLNDTNREHISRFLADLNTSLGKLDRLLEEYNGVLSENKSNIVESTANLRASLRVIAERIDAITYNMEGASRNMNEFSRRIRDNPQLLLGVGAPGAEPTTTQ